MKILKLVGWIILGLLALLAGYAWFLGTHGSKYGVPPPGKHGAPPAGQSAPEQDTSGADSSTAPAAENAPGSQPKGTP